MSLYFFIGKVLESFLRTFDHWGKLEASLGGIPHFNCAEMLVGNLQTHWKEVERSTLGKIFLYEP